MRMRRFAVPLAVFTLIVALTSPAAAATGAPKHDHEDAGEESQAVAEAADWFTSQRLAPNGAVDPNAYAAGAAQAAALPSGGRRLDRADRVAGHGRQRLLRLAAVHRPDQRLQQLGCRCPLGVRSDDCARRGAGRDVVRRRGRRWGVEVERRRRSIGSRRPTRQDTLSIGALLVTGSGSRYTVYAGTGEANTSQDSYAGVGVIASTDGGATWHRVGGPELNGALIFRLAQDGSPDLRGNLTRPLQLRHRDRHGRGPRCCSRPARRATARTSTSSSAT